MKILLLNVLVLTFYTVHCAELNIPNIKLNNGHEMPILGLGVWQMSGSDAHTAIKEAIDIGYRHIDTAYVYGNEADVGKAVNELIHDGKVKREDLFIVSKVWPDTQGHTREDALKAVKDALHKMDLKYLDLMLIHRPQKDYLETWKGLEDAVNEKLVKSIGVSNFVEHQIDDLMTHSTIKPAVNQILSHPYETNEPIIEHSKKNHIAVTAYSPLGSGGHASLLKDDQINKIAKAHDRSAAQILLRFHVQKDVIVLTKSNSKEHLIENAKIFDFKLTDAEMKDLETMHS